MSASQDVAQLQEVHVPGVAEDLTQGLLLRGQHLIGHREQEVAAGRPLVFQALLRVSTTGLSGRLSCMYQTYTVNAVLFHWVSMCQWLVVPLGSILGGPNG